MSAVQTEILDKISILRIKQQRIKDPQKLEHVRHELQRLSAIITDIPDCEAFIDELTIHNSVIWDIEDEIRRREKQQCFDAGFIAIARKVHATNDLRFAVKDAVNRHFNSAIREQKSYD